jgi:DNA-binding beta-propeller fold protein YncE
MLYVNNEGTSTVQAIDEKSWTVTASWSVAPCDGPTGIAYDRANDRLISGCSEHTIVSDPKAHKIVATIDNGGRVDALGWDPTEKLIYVPSGAGKGTVTVARQDGPDKYTVIATVETVPGAKTIAVDPVSHTAYLFQPEYGPPPAGAAAPAGGRRGRGPSGPMVAAWFVAITH